jgi:hypothetical protein
MRTVKGICRSRPNAGKCSEGGGKMRRRILGDRERRMLQELRDWEVADSYGDEEPPRCCVSHNIWPGDSSKGILHW